MQAIAHEGLVAIEVAATDGLLDYLHTLYRVAHAPRASHWCTPGHNRGRALTDAPMLAVAATAVPLVPCEEAR